MSIHAPGTFAAASGPSWPQVKPWTFGEKFGQLASQGIVYASGTQYSGKLTDFFHYWLRFHPQFWKQLGLGWNDAEWAMRIYGVVEQQVREHEEAARRGSGQTDVTVTTVPAPGISAKLLPHLMADLVFLGVLDVGAYMPPRIEVPIVVPMVDPALEVMLAPVRDAQQEARRAMDAATRRLLELAETIVAGGAVTEATLASAREDATRAEVRFEEANADLTRVQGWVQARDLPKHYESIVETLEDAAKEGNSGAAMAKATIPRWWSVLPCAEPRFTVTHTLRDTWGDVLGTETILTTPLLAADHRYPLEVRMHQEVAKEREAGNVTMLYFEQNGDEAKGKRNLASRLAWVLREFHPWTLANTVEAEDREAAIRSAVQAQQETLLVPYRRVQEGLNLQDCVDTILWAEMALNFFALDQASRRHWRMGRQKVAKIIYVVYANSEGHAKLCRLAHQSGAAAAFAGEPARGALVEHVGANKTMLSRLGSSLEELEAEASPALASQEELEAAFARRGEELERTLRQGRQWAGYVDTLPERLSAFHAARLAPAAVVEADVLEEAAPEMFPSWQQVQPALADVDEEARADLDADVMEDVTPAAMIPAHAGGDIHQRQAPVPLWEVVEPVPVAPSLRAAPLSARPAPRTPQAPRPASAPRGAAKAAGSYPPLPGTITVQWWNLVVQFPRKGTHLEAMRQLSRTYGGGFDWGMEAWVFPLDVTKQPVHAFDAVREAFPHLEGMEEAEARALEKLLTQLRSLYERVHDGRLPDEEALRREVKTCSAAQRWIRELHRRLEAKQQPAQARA